MYFYCYCYCSGRVIVNAVIVVLRDISRRSTATQNAFLEREIAFVVLSGDKSQWRVGISSRPAHSCITFCRTSVPCPCGAAGFISPDTRPISSRRRLVATRGELRQKFCGKKWGPGTPSLHCSIMTRWRSCGRRFGGSFPSQPTCGLGASWAPPTSNGR